MNNDFIKNGVDEYGVDKGEIDYFALFISVLLFILTSFILFI